LSQSVSFQGTTYTIPADGEEDWAGTTKTDGLIAALANFVEAGQEAIKVIDDGDSPYTVETGKTTIYADPTSGAITTNLPLATGSGRILRVVNSRAAQANYNAIGLICAGSDVFLDSNDRYIRGQYESMWIQDVASAKWAVIGHNMGLEGAWTTYTPASAWSTNTTVTGKYRRNGDLLEVRIRAELAGAPDAVTFTADLPSNLTLEAAKMAGGGDGLDLLGSAVAKKSTDGTRRSGQVRISDSNTLSIWATGANGLWDEATPHTFANNDGIDLFMSGPCTQYNDRA